MFSSCNGNIVPVDRLHPIIGDGPYRIDQTYDGSNGHKILILQDGTGQHTDCQPTPSILAKCAKGMGTSSVWIGTALLAAGIVIGILGIIGKLPLGPIGSPLLTALAGTCFIGTLVNMVRQHGFPCRPPEG